MKKLKATHQGQLDLNGIKVSCAVLEDGTRVISERSLANAIGIRGGGSYWEKRKKSKDSKELMPEYLSLNSIQPYISEALKISISKSISYIPKVGKNDQKSATGFKAEILPEICDAWIKANKDNVLTESQQNVANNAYLILKGFATVGIIALVDEATGYQYDRERDELQKILKAYISTELLKWQKTFPDTYYKEIFRLNGWNYTVQDIKKRPGVVGKWTNKIIYEQLPKGVLAELKNKTPKSQAGNYTARFFQSLTPDTGNPHLSAQLNQIIAIMRISDNWKQFISNFNKMVDRKNGVLELKFEDLEYKDEPKKNNVFDTQLKGLLSVPPPNKDK